MFVLTCPHCQQKREEEEFSYAGEAFIARPASPEIASDEQWGDYLFMRKNPKG
jgi:sarcosine oxidase, subunit delta